MDLLAEQRAERRERILSAARELIERVGYEGVTIRDLARASRVSVPTLYKFFGDKDTLLIDAVEDQFTAVMQSIEQTPGITGLDLLLAILEGCSKELLRTSRYSKAVIAVFVHSGKTSAVMHVIGHDLSAVLTNALEDMKQAGDLARWVDARALAERLSAHQTMVCIEWESGNITNRLLYPTMAYGACMMLAGAVEGKAARRLGRLIPKLQADVVGRRREIPRSRKATSAKSRGAKSAAKSKRKTRSSR